MSNIVHAETIYSYFGEKDGELSFETGVVLKILEKLNNDWWIAYDESRRIKGLVPREHLKEIQNGSAGFFENEDSNGKFPSKGSIRSKESNSPAGTVNEEDYVGKGETFSDNWGICEDGYMRRDEINSLSKSMESIYEISEDDLDPEGSYSGDSDFESSDSYVDMKNNLVSSENDEDREDFEFPNDHCDGDFDHVRTRFGTCVARIVSRKKGSGNKNFEDNQDATYADPDIVLANVSPCKGNHDIQESILGIDGASEVEDHYTLPDTVLLHRQQNSSISKHDNDTLNFNAGFGESKYPTMPARCRARSNSVRCKTELILRQSMYKDIIEKDDFVKTLGTLDIHHYISTKSLKRNMVLPKVCEQDMKLCDRDKLLPYHEQPYYVGKMSRCQSEDFLMKRFKRERFLLRDSESRVRVFCIFV